MAFQIDTGSGQTATINEPTRDQFAATLGGAVSYSLANMTYKLLEVMGNALGSFMAGIAVNFLDRIEPSLVNYAAPLIDLLLAQEGLQPEIRTFLTQLRSPTDAGAAGMLMGLGSQAGGAIAGSVFDAALKPVTNAINAAIRPSVPGVGDLASMFRRGAISEERADTFFAMNGYFSDLIAGYKEIARPRAGVDDLYGAVLRHGITQGEANDELLKQGYTQRDINLFTTNLEHLLAEDALLTALHRGEMSPTEVRTELTKHGYKDIDITTILTIGSPIPGPTDLVRMAVREAFTDEIAAKYGYDADYPEAFTTFMGLWGFSPEWARYYWRAKWELPSAGMGYEMLHRGIIDAGTLDELLRVQDYPSYWRERLIALSYNPLTRVDVRRMYKMGVLDRIAVKKTYADLGYDEVNAELLTRFTEVSYAPDSEDPLQAKKDLTETLITACYKKGVITRSQAAALLLQLHYEATEVEWLLALAEAEDVTTKRPDYLAQSKSDLTNVVEAAYIARTIDIETATSYLTTVGMTTAEIALRLSVLEVHAATEARKREIAVVGDAYKTRALTHVQTVTELGRLNLRSTEQERYIAEWEVERGIGSRRLSVTEYSNAYYQELLTLEEVTDALRGLGYSERDIPILLTLKIE